MKAAVYTGLGQMEVKEVAKPIQRNDNIILRVVACGICGTDQRTFWHGDPRAEPPWILGHEVVGVIESISEKAQQETANKIGDRIVVISTIPCGKCYFCKCGYENMCTDGRLLGYHPLQGAFAEYLSVEPVAFKKIRLIPADLSSEYAAIVDPLACAINGMNKLKVELGSTVLIIGSGPIGNMQAGIARAQGASKIIMVDILQDRLDLSRKTNGDLCMEYYLSPGQGPLPEVLAMLNGEGADRIITSCSSNDAQEQALSLARTGARIVFFGGLPKTKPTIRFESNIMHYKEITVLGCYGSTYEDELLAFTMIRNGWVNAKAIVKTMPLQKIAEAMTLLKTGKALRVVVIP